MNKIIKTLAAFSLLAFAAACSKEVSSTPAGEEVTVTFSVTSPEFQTKAVSDGNTVDKVKCAAYDADGNLLAISAVDTPVEMTSGKATWAVSLVSGQTYSFAFWAYSSKQEAYAFDATDAKVTVDYSKVTANDDTFDAFYAYKADFTVNGAFTETVTLTRPFAQLNLGASDLAEAEKAGFELATAAVSVKGVANTLSLKDGKASGSETATFAAAGAPLSEKLTVSGTEYDYVSMAYVLPGEALADVTYTLASAAGKSIDVSVPNAPLKANYRTNVVGDLFTADGELKIELKPGYDGDEEAPTTEVSNADELAKALAVGGKIVVVGEISEIDFSTVTKDVKLVLNAKVGTVKFGNDNGATISLEVAKDVDYPAFKFNGGAIKNLTVKGDPTSSKSCSSGFITRLAGSGAGSTAYFSEVAVPTVENLTIEGVNFTKLGIDIGYSGTTQTIKNVTVKDCNFTDLTWYMFHANGVSNGFSISGDIVISGNKATFINDTAIDWTDLGFQYSHKNIGGVDIRLATNTTNVVVENNTFTNVPLTNGSYAVLCNLNYAAGSVKVSGNTIDSRGRGIKVENFTKAVVDGNEMKVDNKAAIRAQGSPSTSPELTITNNKVTLGEKATMKVCIEPEDKVTTAVAYKLNVSGNTGDGTFVVKSPITVAEDSVYDETITEE